MLFALRTGQYGCLRSKGFWNKPAAYPSWASILTLKTQNAQAHSLCLIHCMSRRCYNLRVNDAKRPEVSPQSPDYVRYQHATSKQLGSRRPKEPSSPITKAPTIPKSTTKDVESLDSANRLAISTPSENSNKYPARLLIYHAGLGRTVFIASVRLTAIFIFIFSSMFIAPAYYYSPFEPTWMAAATLVGGAIPLLFTAFTTPPFVTYVHLGLPIWARISQPRLLRFACNLPGSTPIDITTLRWIWPRVTRLQAQELYIYKNQIGAMTLRREIPQHVLESRRWYDWRPLTKFYVAGKGGKTVEKGVWEEVMGSVLRGWGKKSELPK